MFGSEFLENLTNPTSKILPKTNYFGGKGGNGMDWSKIFGITGTNKTATDEIKKPGDGYYGFFGQTPGDTARMYADIAKEGKEFDLENKLKLNVIDKITKLGSDLGMGGAQYEYQAALQANKNSAYVTVNSKMNPGPVRYIQPYQSYFST